MAAPGYSDSVPHALRLWQAAGHCNNSTYADTSAAAMLVYESSKFEYSDCSSSRAVIQIATKTLLWRTTDYCLALQGISKQKTQYTLHLFQA
jgi:hypothetical protein